MIIGLGIDLVDIPRAARLVEGRDERQLMRIFTFREIDYARRRAEPARHFAARLAAKEAAFKAMAGNDLARAVGWRDIEVVPHSDGRPALEFHGHARRRVHQLGVLQAFVSLTHSDSTAGAVVILVGGGGLPPGVDEPADADGDPDPRPSLDGD